MGENERKMEGGERLEQGGNLFHFVAEGIRRPAYIFQFSKSTVDYFVSRDSTAYIVCIDASKAFDKINHAVLMKKLVD